MTIEFVVVFPVLIAVALVSTNVILFLSECAGFDRQFRQEVARLAPSPSYGQEAGDIASEIQDDLSRDFDRDYLDLSVSASQSTGGLVDYEAELVFSPTLFGHGNLTGAFGVSFPRITHHQSISVDQYKPGVLL